MSSDRPNQTLADYVVLAISPALVMGLVASLVFFLLEVLYAGQYAGRLQWILFFFVFGEVLVVRISLTGHIAGRAGLYGSVLALLTYVGMQLYLKYFDDTAEVQSLTWLINLFLVGLVWWCAHRLTTDCTNVDEEADVTGEGLLQAAGLEEKKGEGRGAGGEDEEPGMQVVGKPGGARLGWWERFQRYREGRKRRRTLGVWVVYFSLAALPLFGLGQSLIPVADVGRRQYAFWLMSVYVGCGLGLLLTTCFLGLRRYVQRRLQMPAAMAGVWLTVGGVMIAALLGAGALLPRPQAEYPLFDFRRAGSEDRTASNWAFKGDSPGKGEGRPGADAPPDRKGPGDGSGTKGQGKGKDGSGQGKDGSGQGKDGSGKGKDGSGKGKDGSGKGNDRSGEGQSKEGRQDGSGQEKGQGESKKGSGGGGSSGKDPRQPKAGNFPHGGAEQRKGPDRGANNANRPGNASTPSSSPSTSWLAGVIRTVAPVLKWIVFVLLALAVVVFVLRALQFLANFTDWARRLLDALRNFWAGLFAGRGRGRAGPGEEGEAAAREAPELPFAAFPNPFAGDGTSRMTPQDLVRYTFAALQAWARERGLGRQPGETPLEFAERLGEESPALEADVGRLAALYARAAYARGGLPANSAEVVRLFWERLETVAEQPLSA